MNNEKPNYLKDLYFNEILEECKIEKSLKFLSEKFKMTEEKILGIVNILKSEGINIVIVKKDDGIYLLNQGDVKYNREYEYHFDTNENNTKSFLVLSDTMLGSIFHQKSILNNLYDNAYKNGIRDVLIVGNITSGLYSLSDEMINTIVAKDTISQSEYVVNNFPFIEGVNTYFITGKKDQTHLTKNKIDIGKQISSKRKDLIYLGNQRCMVYVDNVKMLMISRNQRKTYTQSYRAQKMIDAMRSENKPDIILYGGLLQAENYTYRNVDVLSIPSVCASTWEMENKEYSNTIGGWQIKITTDRYGKLKKLETLNDIYYKTTENDYLKTKTLIRKK